MVDRGHGTLGPCVVGVREERCCRPWCVAGLLWRGLGPPQEMSDGSRECSSRSPPVPVKVNQGEEPEGGGAAGLGALLARPVGISVVLDANTEIEIINGLHNGVR